MIGPDDRVSQVLAQDESLIEVFTALSPAFERLRNPRMRKVMSRLVTVAQAARIAGVDAGELVRRLNEGTGTPRNPAQEETTSHDTEVEAAAPAALRAIPDSRQVHLDVREDLRSGREPFSRIMAARREVPADGALVVRAIFEPVPLYAVLEKQGFAHWTERLAADDWRVWFYPAGSAEPVPPPAPAASQATSATADDVVVLDVRGLEPPEPMLRTLAALEELPAGATLVQLNVRVPQFLLPLLAERGFTYEIREQEPELVRIFIRRRAAE